MDDGAGHLIRPHSIIGVGAYGTVFKAFRLPKEDGDDEERWRDSAKAVAVKQTIFKDVVDDMNLVLKEVSYLSNLQHPNIVAYYTAFISYGGPTVPPLSSKNVENEGERKSLGFAEVPSLCIVEELVEGASVSRVLGMISSDKTMRLMEEAEIAAVMYDVLLALLYIHEDCRLVHRDIKPLNMLLDHASASVKLCDFGTCADLSQRVARYTIIGTIGWIAPEVLDSGMMDYRSGHVTSHSFPSDVWSLGVSALEMARPRVTKRVLSELIKDISLSPCSAQPTVEVTRKTFLQGSLPSGNLLDFIACCLRKDPQIRLTVRQLLQHPFIVLNNVENSWVRKKHISNVLSAVYLAKSAKGGEENDSVNEDIILPQLASSTQSKNRCMEAIAAMKRDFFAAQTPLLEKNRMQHYTWCLPGHLANLSSSDDYRYLPRPSKLQGFGSTTAGANLTVLARNSAQSKSLFDSVVLPATVESQRVVLGIMRKYRRLGVAHRTEGLSDINRLNEAYYTPEELCCRNLNHEGFRRLYDDLIRKFREACMANSNFEINFLSAFTQSLTSSDEDVCILRRFIVYLHQLQKEEFMHTHRGQLEHSESRTSPPRNYHAAPEATRLPTFVSAEDWIRFPRMPQSAPPINTNGKECDAGTDCMRQHAALVNPSAYLFNKWLKGKQESVLGPF